MSRSSNPMWGPARAIAAHELLEFVATELVDVDEEQKAFLAELDEEEAKAWWEGHDEGITDATEWLLTGRVVIIQGAFVRQVLIEDLASTQADMDVCGDPVDHRAYEGFYYVTYKALQWLCGEPIGCWFAGVEPWVMSGAVAS